MIGRITFYMGSRLCEAMLDDDGRWQCEDASIRQLLHEICPSDPAWRLPDAVAGRHLLYQASARLGGEVHIDSDSNHRAGQVNAPVETAGVHA